MKKVLLLITMLLSVCIVKAATLKDLNLMWENSEVGNIQYIEKQGTSYYVYSQNGIFRFYDSSKLKYDKYSIEGTYLFKKENNQILLFISKENQSAFKIIDYNFNEIKSVNLDFRRFAYYEKTNDGYIFIGNTYPYGLKYFKTDKDLKITDSGSIVTPTEAYLGGIANGKIYFRTNYQHYYVYDNGFSEISAEEYSNAHPTDYNIWEETSGQHQQTNNEISPDLYNRIMAKYPAPTDKTSTSAQILKDGENYVVLYMGRDSHWSANETYIHRELKLVYYDKNLNEKWHKTFPEWNSGEEICGRIEDNSYIGFSNGNIILLSNEREEQIFNVYDRSGNLLKDFKDKLHPSREYRPMYVDLAGDSLFLVYDRNFVFCFTKQDSVNKVFPTLLANEDSGALTPTRIYYFAVTYNIKTVVKGKGNIQISQSVAGKNDEVTFTITPEEGYVLGEVRVTDANGKTIVFKNNTFTMPSADVTIEAVFLPVKNPETKDIVIISISILAILAASIFFLNRKKIKEIS